MQLQRQALDRTHLMKSRSMHRLPSRWLLLSLVLLGTAAVPLPDDPRPINRSALEARNVLLARDFEALERRAAVLRQKPRVLSDGQPELSGFYAGVAMCVQMRCGDQTLPPQIWEDHALLLDAWIAAYPKSVTAHLAKATFEKESAWYARGTGYANSVSPAARKQFDERMRKARTMFEAMPPEAKSDPAWYAGMLSIALGQSWRPQEFEELYNEGTARFPAYLPLYFTKASYVSPRWGGSIEAFRAYVDQAVKATAATMGDAMYARLNWSSWTSTMFTNGQADWSRMRNGFVRLTRDYPDPWNINHFAKFACLAGDGATLRELLPMVGQSPIISAWGSREYYEQCSAKARQ